MRGFDLDVRGLLCRLDAADPNRSLFGSQVHDYHLDAPLSPSLVRAKEERFGVTFPSDYHEFLTRIGDGGAGPNYGIFKLGEHDDGHRVCSWDAAGLVGDLAQPFPHTTEWNLPDSFWAGRPEAGPGCTLEEEDALNEAWDRRLQEIYWTPWLVNGALPISHEGCALRQWLVVTGPEAGNVWRDRRADHRGISPLVSATGERVAFLAWYITWLEGACRRFGVPV